MKQRFLVFGICFLKLALDDTHFAQSAENYGITTIAGSGVMSAGGDGGLAVDGQLFSPSGLAVDSQGNIYIADSGNHKIRIVTLDGKIDTFAGNGTAGHSGDGGPPRMAQLNTPYAVAVDPGGTIYIAEFENARIRKISPQGIITTIAGTGIQGFSGDGGPATAAQLNHPSGIALDAAGNLLIADRRNHRIRKVGTDGVITTVVGTGVMGYGGDGGAATSAQITYPGSVAVDASANFYFTDSDNDRVRKVSVQGIISTLSEKAGARGLAADASGTIYSASDRFVRKISPTGVVTTIGGVGFPGYAGDGGPAIYAGLSGAIAITLDAAGRILVADSNNNRIRRLEKSTLPQPALTTWILPSFALFVGGEGGATWNTRLQITNVAGRETALFLKFLGHDQDGRTEPETPWILKPFESAALYPDRVAQAYGAFRIRATSPDLVAVGETATGSTFPPGTRGQTVPVLGAGRWITQDRPGSIISVREDTSFRTNLVLTNALETPLDIDVGLFGESGVLLESARYPLLPLEMRQVSRLVRVLGIAGDVLNARVLLSTPTAGGAFAAYASVIDNRSNDPRTLLPTFSASGSGPFTWILPSSARSQGANGSVWTTDLVVANVDQTDATFTLKFLGHDVDGRSGTEKSVLLAAGKSARYPDVLGTVFGLSEDYGAIQVNSPNARLAFSSQTSTPGANGTYGQSVPAFTSDDLIQAGLPRTFPLIREEDVYRTNLVLTNAADFALEVEARLLRFDGEELGVRRYSLPPLGMSQINRVPLDFGVPMIGYPASLQLSTPTPNGKFAAYVAAIDNYSNDPRTVLSK